MHAIVDEARRAVFIVVAAPQHVQHITQRRLADFAAHSIAVNLQHFLDGAQSLASQDLPQLAFREGDALAQRLLRFFLKLRRNGLQKLLANFGATPTAR